MTHITICWNCCYLREVIYTIEDDTDQYMPKQIKITPSSNECSGESYFMCVRSAPCTADIAYGRKHSDSCDCDEVCGKPITVVIAHRNRIFGVSNMFVPCKHVLVRDFGFS